MSKVLSFMLAALVGLTLSAGFAKPAAANYGGCGEAARYATSYGAFKCGVNAEGQEWLVEATRQKAKRGLQFRLDDGYRWKIAVNGKTVENFKYGEVATGDDAWSGTFVDVAVKRYPFKVTLQRDGARVYGVKITRRGVKPLA